MILFPVTPQQSASIATAVEVSRSGDRGMLCPCFWLSQCPVSTSPAADSCSLGAAACLDCLAPLLRLFLDVDQNMDPNAGVADDFAPCGGPDCHQPAPAPPMQAGRALRERRIISALAVLQQNASGDDTSLGTA